MKDREPASDVAFFAFGCASIFICGLAGLMTYDAIQSGDYDSILFYWGAAAALFVALGIQTIRKL